MIEFSKPISIRWSDIDPNFHLRHSAYYDLGAQLRTDILDSLGITLSTMQENNFGPVLFREECVFAMEIRPSDKVTINMKLRRLKNDHSRFSVQHEFVKDDGTICATLVIDGAWMDTQARKLSPPPQMGIDAVNAFPKTKDFEQVA